MVSWSNKSSGAVNVVSPTDASLPPGNDSSRTPMTIPLVESETRSPEATLAVLSLEPNPQPPPGPDAASLMLAQPVQSESGEDSPGDLTVVEPHPLPESPASAEVAPCVTESGTWTPCLVSSDSDIELVVRSARFTQVGLLVTALFDISLVNLSNPRSSSAVIMTGLPAQSVNDSGRVGGAVIYYSSQLQNRTDEVNGIIMGASREMQLWQTIRDGGRNHLRVCDITNISAFSGVIQYSCAPDKNTDINISAS